MCVHPWTKGFPPPLPSQIFHQLSHAGGMAAVSLAMPTKLRDSAGRECGRTFLYLQEELFLKLSNLVGLLSWSFMLLPTNRFPTALQPLDVASTCKLSETLFNNTFQQTLPPCRSIAILPIVEIESLNTSVRVCFAQPSHSGAECDPRHRGAAFCIGIQQPQRSTSTGPSPEVMATPIESTDALAAGPKNGITSTAAGL